MKQCEAMVWVGTTWARCGKSPADVHHRLTRARGGLILDAAGETYHLMLLCRSHHGIAHDTGTAYEAGLLLDGYVVTGTDGRPVYTGTDPTLSQLYPAVPVPVGDLQEDLRSAESRA